jgi:hypothetical protein
MSGIEYPFAPKSTRSMQAGQFWAVPLLDGRFACGRVIALREQEGGKPDLRMFLAGLIDWVGASPPTAESIGGCGTIGQGAAHIKTILHTGGEILGCRSLELDGIEPDFFLSQAPGRSCCLQRGFQVLRYATIDEQRELQTFGTWGYMVIQRLAEKHFVCGA